MTASPRVLQCLLVAGDIDYVVLVRSRDVAHYQEFARRMIRSAPGVRSYTSEIVLTVGKATTELPIDPSREPHLGGADKPDIRDETPAPGRRRSIGSRDSPRGPSARRA